MRDIGLLARFICLLTFAAGVAGCGGSAHSYVPPPQAQEVGSANSGVPFPVPGVGSWMRPDAKQKTLLYVATSFDVLVYSYPWFHLVGTLTGLNQPAGECVDKRGNVWIVESGGSVVEFAHGGTSPIRTLTVHTESVFGCAVDPVNGNLAVSGLLGQAAGAEFLFEHARGVARVLRDYDFLSMLFSAYDSKGNLFIDGQTQYGAGITARLIGTHYFSGYNLKTPKIRIVGALQYLDSRLMIGDQGASYTTPVIYRTKLTSGRTAEMVGKVTLKNATQVPQFLIVGDKVFASDVSGLLVYSYPAGGLPIKTIKTRYSVNSVAMSPP